MVDKLFKLVGAFLVITGSVSFFYYLGEPFIAQFSRLAMVFMGIMLIGYTHQGVAQFLATKIVNTRYVFIDLWSFIHFGAGILIYFFLTKEFITALLVVGLYELVEYILAYANYNFRKERAVDTFWDILIGISGWFVAQNYIGGLIL